MPPLLSSILISVLLAVALIACGRTELPSQQAPSPLAVCVPDAGKLPLVSGAECGTISVPKNPTAEQGPELAIQVMRLPAIAAVPESDPLVIIAGGPGQSAIDMAETLLHFFGGVRQQRDLIFIDQRGTGRSHALACDALPDFSNIPDLVHQRQQYIQGLIECAAGYGDSLLFYTTPYAVEDLERVRQALGYARWNFWAGSYGTRVALEYMRRYPERVRSAVLDGLAPVELALPWHAEQDARAALAHLAATCDADCQSEFGDWFASVGLLAERLAEQPVPLVLDHPRTGASTPVVLTQAGFAGVLRMALYQRELASLIPLAVQRAASDDWRVLAALLLLADEQQAHMGLSLGMHYTILCNEDFPLVVDRPLTDAARFFGLNAMEDIHAICDAWPRAALSEAYYQPVISDLPVLLLSGELDPVTPPSWGERVAENLPNSRHIRVAGGHHIVSFEGCVPQLINRYLRAGHPRDLNESCVEQIQPRPAFRGVVAEFPAGVNHD